MNNIIKKLLLSLVVVTILLACISCGNERIDAKPDAVSFRFLNEIQNGNQLIGVYELENIDDVYYFYQKLDKPSTDTWIINYIYTYEYIVDDDTFPDDLYEPLYDVVTTNLERYKSVFNVTFTLNKDKVQEEREISLDNINDVDEIYLIDLYIPYKLVINGKNYVVMIPVYSFIALRTEKVLSFNNKTYNFNDFVSQSNVLKK